MNIYVSAVIIIIHVLSFVTYNNEYIFENIVKVSVA